MVCFSDSSVSPQGWNQDELCQGNTGAHHSIIIPLANHCVMFKFAYGKTDRTCVCVCVSGLVWKDRERKFWMRFLLFIALQQDSALIEMWRFSVLDFSALSQPCPTHSCRRLLNRLFTKYTRACQQCGCFIPFKILNYTFYIHVLLANSPPHPPVFRRYSLCCQVETQKIQIQIQNTLF